MKTLFLLIILGLAGCEDPVVQDVGLLKDTVISASVYSYDELVEGEKSKVGKYAKYFQKNENWNEGTKFDPENAFYVRATINRNPLAILSLTNSCGTVGNNRICAATELNKKTSELLGHENPRMLYGKYKNKWQFETSSGTMPETEKFVGHRLISIKQSDDKLTDNVFIGPLPERPTKLVITLFEGYPVDGINHNIEHQIN